MRCCPNQCPIVQTEYVVRLGKWFTPLGVVKEGAYVDLIIVDGNPLKNLDLVADPGKKFVLIMKGSKIYKNTFLQKKKGRNIK